MQKDVSGYLELNRCTRAKWKGFQTCYTRANMFMKILILLTLFSTVSIGLSSHQGETFITIAELVSTKLCNNDQTVTKSDGKDRCSCPRQSDDIISCDSRSIKAVDCKAAEATVRRLSYVNMLNKLAETVEDDSIRRVNITITDKSVSRNDIAVIGHELDKFLTPRPWWQVVREPHPWQEQPSLNIVLERYHQHFEPYLRYLASIQYIDWDTCRKSPMLLGKKNCMHPGLSSVLGMYYFVRHDSPYAVNQVYVSDSNSPNDSTAFITGSDCPDKINKWECAFLPTTYCPVPSSVSTCRTRNCVASLPESYGFSVRFDAASETGQIVDPKGVKSSGGVNASREEANHRERVKRVHALGKAPRNAQQESLWRASKQIRDPYVRLLPGRDSVQTLDYQRSNWPQSFAWMFKFKFLLRHNSWYRAKVAERVHQVRTKEFGFPATTRCVAANIRLVPKDVIMLRVRESFPLT